VALEDSSLRNHNLRHPIHAAKAVKATLATRLRMWRFGNDGRQRFRDDVRYNLQNVTDGFAPSVPEGEDDTRLLKRICAAYIAAAQQQRTAPAAYHATAAWEQVRHRSLGPVRGALLERDTDALGKMYRNFFRDPCSSGILAPPNGMYKAYFGRKIKDMYRHFYLSHVLWRLDYWKTLTHDEFTLRDLRGPGVGNPFGLVLDGTHIAVGSEYAHYCAYRVAGLLPHRKATVAEIGGGFGAMAYYLLRDHSPTAYMKFDVPETVALSSFYLMKAFPELNFLLYGEEELTQKALERVDVALMPMFAMASVPASSVDVTFSSHAFAQTSANAMVEYLEKIGRMTRQSFLYMGNEKTTTAISEHIQKEPFALLDTRSSGWHSHKVSGAGVGGAAGLAASATFEQCFTRTIAAESSPAAHAVETRVS
jgi:hypothetical protein